MQDHYFFSHKFPINLLSIKDNENVYFEFLNINANFKASK